jgi:hypothetical protein
MGYAEHTSVSPERTEAEIKRLLLRHGAIGISSSWMGARARIEFVRDKRLVRFTLPLPDPSEKRFALTPAGRRRRCDDERIRSWEQACRQRWRALLLAIKAKLEAVAAGIVDFEEEFLAYVVDPATNKTVSETIRPQIEASYNEARARPFGLLEAPTDP